MSARHQVQEIMERMPRWVSPFVHWSAGFSVDGPRWMPRVVRRVPLHFGIFVSLLYIRGWL